MKVLSIFYLEKEMQNLARDLGLFKEKELPGSRLKQWNLLQSRVSITFFRNRHLDLAPYFFF